MAESTSAEGRKTPAIALREFEGASSLVVASWVRRSGEAPTRNQRLGAGEKAIWVWERGLAFRVPARKPAQFEQAQFH